MLCIALILVGLSPLFLYGNTVANGERNVLCYYSGRTNYLGEFLPPEDVNTNLCTHLAYAGTELYSITDEAIPRNPEVHTCETGEIDKNTVTTKLKQRNPELKVLMLSAEGCCGRPVPKTSSERSAFVNKTVTRLQSLGFDGLEFIRIMSADENESDFGLLLSDLRAEFDKHGFLLSVNVPGIEHSPNADLDFASLARSCDFISIRTTSNWGPWTNNTGLLAPPPYIKSTVDFYISKNIPAEKLVISIVTFGMAAQLKNVDENGLGAEAYPPDIPQEFCNQYLISHGQLLAKFLNKAENWTIHRDEETNSPYASNKDGLWVSYDDFASVTAKCWYVLQKNLWGASVLFIEMDDYRGRGGEGPYPITRVIFRTIRILRGSRR